jgi:short-subunit dehydrogenase
MNRYLMLAAAGVGGYLAWRALRPTYDFRGKTVLITGGSRGLGLLLAREFAARGARLGICARDSHELQRAADELRDRGAEVIAVPADVTDRDQVRRVVGEVRRTLGPIDVLVNNAGIIAVGPFDTQRPEDFEESLRVHVWAALYATWEVLPDMRARRAGRIVNVSSFGGKVAVPHMLPYVTGKFALVGLSNGLRAELARDGVVVTTVCPGLMRTGSHLHAEFKGRHEEEYAWFAIGNGIPGFSMSGGAAARQVVAACARGDAEVVLTLPAKLAVAAQAVAPTLTANVLALANRYVLPDAGGIGPARRTGAESRGKTPPVFTALSDRAAAANNET